MSSTKSLGNREGESIRCPLFKSYTDHSIRCESHVPDCNAIELRYQEPTRCAKQIRLYCERNWKRCEHYLSCKHWKWEDE